MAVDDIVEHTKAQFDRTVSIVLAEIRSHLAERGVDPSELDLDSVLSKLNHPFSELDTKYKQDKRQVGKLICLTHTPTCKSQSGVVVRTSNHSCGFL